MLEFDYYLFGSIALEDEVFQALTLNLREIAYEQD